MCVGSEAINRFLAVISLAGLTAACSATLPSTQIASASVVPPGNYHKIIGSGIPATIAKGAQVLQG
jgi:hypothetical protein